MTTFADLVFSLGSIPCLGGAILPFPGNYWWVNETTGNDGFPGNTPQQPFATLARAQAVATAGNNDVVFFSGTIHTTATIAWAKDAVHLIGLTAPSNNSRARISSSGSTVFTPMVNVTAQGCIIANLDTFYGYANASAQICWAEAGGRNAYLNVGFKGGGNATAAAQAGMRSLTIAGNGENKFLECYIGLDTVTRAAANASLEFLSGTARNTFRNCVFPVLSSDAGAVAVKAGAAAMDRWQLFDNCAFINDIASTGTTLTAMFSIDGAAGGLCLLNQSCVSVGATHVSAAGPVYVGGAVPTAATSNIAVAAA